MRVKWNRHLDGLPRQKNCSTSDDGGGTQKITKRDLLNGKIPKDEKKDNYFLKFFKLKSKTKTLTCTEDSTRKAFSLGPEFRGASNGSEYIGKRLQYHSCLLSSPLLTNDSNAFLGRPATVEEEICIATAHRAVIDRRKCGYQVWRRQEWFTSFSLPRGCEPPIASDVPSRRASNIEKFSRSPDANLSRRNENRTTANSTQPTPLLVPTSPKPSDEDSACEVWDRGSSSLSATGQIYRNAVDSVGTELANTSPTSTGRQSACLIGFKEQTAFQADLPVSEHTLNKGGRVVTTHRTLSTPTEPKKSTWVSKAELTQEIQHLGALCEARTKELNMLKMQLKHAALGFEAFGVLSQYLTEELDAFSHPKFVAELHRTQLELNKAGSQLQFYQKQLEELKETHAQEIIALTTKLGQAHREEIDALKKKHSEELAEVETLHKEQVACLKKSLVSALEEVEKKHAYVLEELNNDYQKHKEEIQRMHAQQIEETQNTHYEAQESLHNQLKEIQKQYDLLQQQTKKAEDAFLRDKNSKVQWMSAKKTALENEVESLKTVLEMKSTEIHALRRENLEMKKELEELPKARETIRKLEAKTEDLQALVKEKSHAQKQMFSEHQQLEKDLEKESKVKERLSMENETLQWRLQQSMESSYILHSLAASQDLREEFAREGYVRIPNRARCSLPTLVGETDMSRSDIFFPSDIMSTSVPSFSPSSKRQDRSNSFTASWHSALSNQTEPVFFSPINEYRRPRSASERSPLTNTKAYLKRTSQNFRYTPKKEKSFRKEDLFQNTVQQGHYKVNSSLEKMEDVSEENLITLSDEDERDNSQESVCKDPLSSTVQEVLESLIASCEKTNDSLNIRKIQEHINNASDTCHKNVNIESCSMAGNEKEVRNRDDFIKCSTPSIQRGMAQRDWTGTDIDITSQTEMVRQVQETLSPEMSEAEQDIIAFVKEADTQESSLVSASLQSSLNSSDDSSWSIPLQHVTHHSISPGEDSSSSYSSKSQEGGSLAEHSDKSSCGDMMGPSDDRHYISSPRSLAGEAMILDETTTSHAHPHRFFLDVPCDLLTEGPLDEMECHDISSSPEEIKGKIVNHICSETPSMETSSQGLLLTDSTNMDVSWGEDEMPSEADV